MARRHAHMTDRAGERSLAFLHRIVDGYHPRDFAVRLWDGTTWEAEPGQRARFTIVLQHPGALRRMFWPANELSICESYLYDDFDVEGDLNALLAMSEYLLTRRSSLAERLSYGKDLLSLPSSDRPRLGRRAASIQGALHSKERDRQAVSYHYDVSNDFYALWLDRRMVYSCAYFAAPADDIDTAQERKLDYICRKLRLRPGERLLDIGCGWGGLVIFAAQRYGVEALGITLSRPQAELAKEHISQAGLQGRCRVEMLDYRDLEEPDGYDKLVSVGMFEHVGQAMLPEYFQRAWRLLRPGGVFLNHGIAYASSQHGRQGQLFFDRYVFPDGELVPLSMTLRAAEMSGFETRDVESLREHYRITLQHWMRRLEAAHDEVRRISDEATYRVWRLYMAAGIYQFATGNCNLYQTLLAKPDRGHSGLPLTRAEWYS